MSTSNSLSPVPIESDSKQSKWLGNRFFFVMWATFSHLLQTGSQGPSLVFAKRKKLEIKTVFNADEDEVAAPKKRKLVPLGMQQKQTILNPNNF